MSLEAPTQNTGTDIFAGIDAIPTDPRMVDRSQPAAPPAQPAAKAPAEPHGGDDGGGDAPVETPKATKETPKETTPATDTDLGDGLSKLRKPKTAPETSSAEPDKNTPVEEPKTPKQLREAYALSKKENASLQAKIDELSRAKEEGTKAEVAKAQAELTAKLEQLQKKYEETETKLRYVDYERSDEFVDKYKGPLDKAWQDAGNKLKGYTVQLEDGTTRPITGGDIADLVSMEPGAAHEKAEKMFGSARGSVVMRYVERVAELNEAKNSALEEWKKKGSEYQEEQKRFQEEARTTAIKMFDGRQEQLRKDAPDLYDFNPEDPVGQEAKEYIESREKLNNLAFKGIGLKDGISPQERMSIMAKAQADVAAASRILPYQILRGNKLEEEVKQLKEKLAKYQKTEPAPGGKANNGSGGKPSGQKSIVDGIDDIPSTTR